MVEMKTPKTSVDLSLGLAKLLKLSLPEAQVFLFGPKVVINVKIDGEHKQFEINSSEKGKDT